MNNKRNGEKGKLYDGCKSEKKKKAKTNNVFTK